MRIDNPSSKIDLRTVAEIGRINNADDLLWLLDKEDDNIYGRKTARLSREELTFLFGISKTLPENANLLEIGRLLGGSTIILATGMPKNGNLTSIDIKDFDDEHIAQALQMLGVGNRVNLILSDANDVESTELYDLIFIDGDHTVDATWKDYNKWGQQLKKGGHLLFHDAIPSSGYTNETWPWQGPLVVTDFITQLVDGSFQRMDDVGTISHFTYIG